MTTLNNVKSIIINHNKITDVSNSPLVLPTQSSIANNTIIQSSTTLLTEKSLPLNHSIQQSLNNKYTNPVNNNLITYESVENSIQQEPLLFANTLTDNENNTNEYIIHGQDDDDYDLTEDSYSNIHLLDGSGYWFYGDKEIDSDTHVFEINEQYKTDNLNYQYKWDIGTRIIYPRKTYNDNNFGILDANYIYIKFAFLDLKYSVDDNIWYRYKWSSGSWIWDSVSPDSMGQIFFSQLGEDNIKTLLSIEKTEDNNNKEIIMAIYINSSELLITISVTLKEGSFFQKLHVKNLFSKKH